MNQLKSLFLHYGPGGNAQVEKLVLGEHYKEVTFIDIPTVASTDMNFEAMVQSYEPILETLSQEAAVHLIGHSFGADVALKLASLYPDKVSKVTLLSPIRSLPEAFVQLAQRLSVLKPENTELLKHLETLKSDIKNKGSFWALVGSMFAEPELYSLYWENSKSFEKYLGICSKVSPLNQELWQAILDDYIGDDRGVYDLELESSIQVVLGKSDPYYSFQKEYDYWANKLGNQQVVAVDCGHFPHLEKETLDFF